MKLKKRIQEAIRSFACVAKGIRPRAWEFFCSIERVGVGLLLFEHFPNNSFGLVYEIYVLTKFRATGVGNRLLAHSEAAAIDSACKTLRLFARALDRELINDEGLMSWYGHKGFSRDASDPGRMGTRKQDFRGRLQLTIVTGNLPASHQLTCVDNQSAASSKPAVVATS